jgi:hypothetical protein
MRRFFAVILAIWALVSGLGLVTGVVEGNPGVAVPMAIGCLLFGDSRGTSGIPRRPHPLQLPQ